MVLWLLTTMLCSKCHVFRYNRTINNKNCSLIIIRNPAATNVSPASSPLLLPPPLISRAERISNFTKLCSCFGFGWLYIPSAGENNFFSSPFDYELVAFEGITWSLVEEKKRDAVPCCQKTIPNEKTRALIDSSSTTSSTKLKEFKPKYNPQVCSVCLEEFDHGDALFTIACDHTFHHDCAVQLFLKDCYKCPCCQRPAATWYFSGTCPETTDIQLSNYGTFFASV